MKNNQIFGILVIGLILTNTAIIAQAASNIIFSRDLGGNSVVARNTVNTFDDAWRSSFGAGTTFESFTFPSTTLATTPNNFNIAFSNNTVTVGLYDYTPTIQTLVVGNFATTVNAGITLQDGAPYPATFYNTPFVNETIGNDNSLNAIKFSFANPVQGFGAFFGDLETRNDGNGKPATIILKFADGTFSSPSPILNKNLDGTPFDESLCGSPTTTGLNFVGCGNRTTRWIGFESDQDVVEMLVIVGDDDSLGAQTNGFGEHFSFIGPTIATKPPVSSAISSTNSSQNSSNNSSFDNSSINSVNSSEILSSTNLSQDFSTNSSSGLISVTTFSKDSSLQIPQRDEFLPIVSSSTNSVSTPNQNSSDSNNLTPVALKLPNSASETSKKSNLSTVRTGGAKNYLMLVIFVAGLIGLAFLTFKNRINPEVIKKYMK